MAALQASNAEQAASNLRAAYPVVSGELRDSIEVVREGSTSPARVFTRISVTSRHAGFYEFGTHRSAPHPTFTPIVRRAREQFRDDVIQRVEARGLQVSGRG